MMVSETITEEAALLGISIAVGAGLFFLYDVLRIFRRILPHGTVWISLEDFLYWIVCTAAVFVMLYQENDGMVRGFALGGVVLGMALYYLILSRLVVRVNVFVLKAVLGFLGSFFGFFLRPVARCCKKISRFFRKQLKKLAKAVSIGIYKQ